MGQCLSKREAVLIDVRELPAALNPIDVLNTFDFKVHIVSLNTAVPGNMEVMYMNDAAISTYGAYTSLTKWPVLALLGEINTGLMVDFVVNRQKPWKCIIYESDSNSVVACDRASSESQGSSAGSTVPEIYPSFQIQRALVALQQQRTSSEMRHRRAPAQTQNPAMDKSWYEIRCYPYTFESTSAILVVQYNVTKHVQRNTALLRMADNHLRVLQQLYPRHFILESSNGEALMEHSDFSMFSDHHESVIVMFADIVGFTSMCKVVTPDVVMQFLMQLYQEFDQLVVKFPELFKYEIAGDCYIVVAGLVSRDTDGFNSATRKSKAEMRKLAVQMMKFCRRIQEIAEHTKMPHDASANLLLHIGIHVGPVVSGIIGATSPKFMLFGDVMNTAARLETTCAPGKVQVSNEMYSLLPSGTAGSGGVWQQTKGIEVRGKGLMDTWLLVSPSSMTASPIDST